MVACWDVSYCCVLVSCLESRPKRSAEAAGDSNTFLPCMLTYLVVWLWFHVEGTRSCRDSTFSLRSIGKPLRQSKAGDFSFYRLLISFV